MNTGAEFAEDFEEQDEVKDDDNNLKLKNTHMESLKEFYSKY